MKKWIFVIFPGAMLGLFLVFYFAQLKRNAERERVHTEQAARQAAEKKAADEATAAKGKLQHAKDEMERLAAVKATEDAKVAAWNADSLKIKDATDKAAALLEKNSREVANLTLEIERLRSLREKTQREFIDLAKASETARIASETAELEVQRTNQMLAKRIEDSLLAALPPAGPGGRGGRGGPDGGRGGRGGGGPGGGGGGARSE